MPAGRVQVRVYQRLYSCRNGERLGYISSLFEGRRQTTRKQRDLFFCCITDLKEKWRPSLASARHGPREIIFRGCLRHTAGAYFYFPFISPAYGLNCP
ncbi:unnamed protein product [Somion occarium]|uniref:Uncharacterized protein n=1 Tax=Somion occarium TaxID=3059160 RepID=A0ABP1D7F4_9APHY